MWAPTDHMILANIICPIVWSCLWRSGTPSWGGRSTQVTGRRTACALTGIPPDPWGWRQCSVGVFEIGGSRQWRILTVWQCLGAQQWTGIVVDVDRVQGTCPPWSSQASPISWGSTKFSWAKVWDCSSAWRLGPSSTSQLYLPQYDQEHKCCGLIWGTNKCLWMDCGMPYRGVCLGRHCQKLSVRSVVMTNSKRPTVLIVSAIVAYWWGIFSTYNTIQYNIFQ